MQRGKNGEAAGGPTIRSSPLYMKNQEKAHTHSAMCVFSLSQKAAAERHPQPVTHFATGQNKEANSAEPTIGSLEKAKNQKEEERRKHELVDATQNKNNLLPMSPRWDTCTFSPLVLPGKTNTFPLFLSADYCQVLPAKGVFFISTVFSDPSIYNKTIRKSILSCTFFFFPFVLSSHAAYVIHTKRKKKQKSPKVREKEAEKVEKKVRKQRLAWCTGVLYPQCTFSRPDFAGVWVYREEKNRPSYHLFKRLVPRSFVRGQHNTGRKKGKRREGE